MMKMQSEAINELVMKKQLLMSARDNGEITEAEYLEEINDVNQKIKETLLDGKKEIVSEEKPKENDKDIQKILESMGRIEADMKLIRVSLTRNIGITNKPSTEIYFGVLKDGKCKTFQEFVNAVAVKMPGESIVKLAARTRTFLYNLSNQKLTKYAGYAFDSKTFILSVR
jgi:hypothetical protein